MICIIIQTILLENFLRAWQTYFRIKLRMQDWLVATTQGHMTCLQKKTLLIAFCPMGFRKFCHIQIVSMACPGHFQLSRGQRLFRSNLYYSSSGDSCFESIAISWLKFSCYGQHIFLAKQADEALWRSEALFNNE